MGNNGEKIINGVDIPVVGTVNDILKQIERFDRAGSVKDVKKLMPDLLRTLGVYVGADFVRLFERTEDGTEYINTFEWNGILDKADFIEENRVKFQISEMGKWDDILMSGKIISISDVAVENGIEETKRSQLIRSGVHHMVMLPIMINGFMGGFIGIINNKSELEQFSLSLLSCIGGHLGATWYNIRMKKAMEDRHNIIRGLTREYTTTWLVRVPQMTLDLQMVGNEDEAVRECINDSYNNKIYSYIMNNYACKFVNEQDRADFIAKTEYSVVKKEINENSVYKVFFRREYNGKTRYYQVSFSLVDKNGNSQDFVMGYKDVTDVTLAEKKSEKQYRSAIEALAADYTTAYLCDLKNDTIELFKETKNSHSSRSIEDNPDCIRSFSHWIKFSYDNLILHESAPDFLTEFDAANLMEKMKNSDTYISRHQTVPSEAGNEYYEVRVSKLYADENDFKVIIGYRPIDNIIKAEREINRKLHEKNNDLIKQQLEVKKANMAKTNFLRRMSHDIRTPINGIRGMIELSSRYPDDINKQREYMDKIRTTSGYLLNLVNNILDMSKLESGEVHLENKPFNLFNLLRETSEVTRMNGAERGIELVVRECNIKHNMLIGSPLHLEQVIMNIEGNAVKYNRDGGKIYISCKEISHTDTIAEFEFICEDTGYGMSKEFCEHIYEPFSQENNVVKSHYDGSGLGMSIVKELVDLQGGNISFSTERGKGTKFVLRMSFKISNEVIVAPKVTNIEDISLKGIKILLVEDNELNMEIAQCLLEDKGAEVVQAWNGKEAVEIFGKSEVGEFDIIIMDIMMPVMGGLEAASTIRRLTRTDSLFVPIIAMSANAFSDDIEQSLASGMNAHIAKPVDSKLLFETIIKYVAIDESVEIQDNDEETKKPSIFEYTEDEKKYLDGRDCLVSISKLYKEITLINFKTKKYTLISEPKAEYKEKDRTGDMYAFLNNIRNRCISADSVDKWDSFINYDMLNDRLKEKNVDSIELMGISGHWYNIGAVVNKYDKEGNVLEILFLIMDIDEQKTKELSYKKELEKAVEEAKSANEAKTMFLRQMSHDIRTPINGIMGLLEMANRNGDDVEKLSHYRERMTSIMEYLLSLVNNILDMGKVESGKIVLEHQPFDLVKILKNQFVSTENQAKNHGVNYIGGKELSSFRHRYLIGSPVHLSRILANLSGNAIKYNRENGTITVFCKELSDDGHTAIFQFTCSDTGMGMSEDFQKHLFEPYAQEGKFTTTSYYGSGLGLSIVKNMVEQMGGTISFESKENSGTTFNVTIPFEIDTSREDGVTDGNVCNERPAYGKKALIVEDNELNMEIAKMLLEDEGFTIVTAANGQEAVSVFEKSEPNEFDFIFMDIMMPVMDGLEATRRIRALDRTDAQEVSIIAMTANAFQDDINRSIEAGMDEHIVKPLVKDEIRQVIVEQIEKRHS